MKREKYFTDDRLNDTGAFFGNSAERKRRRNRFYRQWQKNTKLMKALRPMIWTAFYNNCEMRKYWKKQMSEFKTEKCEDSKKKINRKVNRKVNKRVKGRRQGR